VRALAIPIPLDKILGEGLTYDDVLLIPRMAEHLPRDVRTDTQLTRQIRIHIPVVSAAMDTVTEARLAIALAQEGGIGIIHKNLSVDAQVQEVDRVKRSANGVIEDPVTLSPEATTGQARELMRRHSISGLPVIDQARRVIGIVTNRDLRFLRSETTPVAEIMTRAPLVTAPPGTTLIQARDLLHKNKVEKLILVHKDGTLAGLITIRDIKQSEEFPSASKDARGRLRVGAAVGVADDERVERLIAAGVDVLVVDTAHGHSRGVIDAIKRYKQRHPVQLVAGNVATRDGARALVDAGVDAVKVGIGPGSICTTRIVAGLGVPQLTAVMDCAAVCQPAGIPVIADGGIRYSGDMVKALAAGASSVMLGGLLAGLEEAPGDTVLYSGRSYRVVRGMGSLGAMALGGKERYAQGEVKDQQKFVPEGVEGMVPYKGSLSPFVFQLVGGLRSGMGYCGVRTIEELQKEARFLRVSSAGLRESHPHDIIITKDAPNYRNRSEDA
jgi:IMP dehydrogenase